MSDSEDPGQPLQPLKDGPQWQVSFAYAYFVILILGVIGGIAASIYSGLIQIQATFTFQANLGWVLEYLAGGLLVIFLLFTFVQVVRITGIGFIRGLINSLARIADSYELPPERQRSEEDQE